MTAAATAAAAIGALWFTGRSLQTTQRQVDITEQGQYTDRYTKAVEQLGSQQVDVRLGAIYALERLAKDSTRDSGTIAQVLSTFVRNRNPGLKDCPTPQPAESVRPLATDVRAAITARQRLRERPTLVNGIDLSRLCLAGVDLDHMDLTTANLTDANLAGATLTYANLERAILQRTDLTRARLHNTYLHNTYLRSTYLISANLRGADLTAANLRGAELRGADLTGADVINADLTGARLTDVKGLK